jgi:hypothetical protein
MLAFLFFANEFTLSPSRIIEDRRTGGGIDQRSDADLLMPA